MNKIIVFDNGLRMSFEKVDYVRSVCVGVFVGAGSRFENERRNGISHLIEHMCFKGTEKRTAFDIVCETDRMGANINAYTSKDNTVYYIQSITEYIDQCCEILSDIVLHHTYPEEELQREKEVVIEEINMCEDTPDDLCCDLASNAFWGDSPLGRTILGPAENVRSITREMLFEYEKERYVSENVVISVVGNISEPEAVALVQKYFNFPNGKAIPPCEQLPLSNSTALTSIKANEQANIVLVFPSCGIGAPSLEASSVMSAIFGGNMSSILFQRLREQMGLAYSVSSYTSVYQNCGAFCIYIGTSPSKVKTSLAEINSIIKEYSIHGFSEEELQRGIMQIKSGYLLGLDKVTTLMRVYGRKALMENKVFNVDETVSKLDSLTLDDVNSAFKQTFVRKPSIGYVGEKPNFDMLSIFDF